MDSFFCALENVSAEFSSNFSVTNDNNNGVKQDKYPPETLTDQSNSKIITNMIRENKFLNIVPFYKPLSERRKLTGGITPLTIESSDFLIPGQTQNFHNQTASENNLIVFQTVEQQQHNNPLVPPLNLPVSPRQNESFRNCNNNENNNEQNPTNFVQKHQTASSDNNAIIKREMRRNSLPKDNKNGHRSREDISSLNSSSLSSKLSNFDKTLMDKSASELLRAATLTNGDLDYDTLKVLLRQQRKAYKKRLEEEKIKREALEEFIVKIGSPRKSVRSADESLRSSSAADTDSILRHLIGHHLRSKSRRRRWSRRSASSTTLQSDVDKPSPLRRSATNEYLATSTAKNQPENFYESTSLFNLPNGFSPHDFLTTNNRENDVKNNASAVGVIVNGNGPADDGLVTMTNGRSIRDRPPRSNNSGENSSYSSARRRRSKGGVGSRQSGSTNGSDNGSSSFPKMSTNRSNEKQPCPPPIAYFLTLDDNDSNKPKEEKEKIRSMFVRRSLHRKEKIEAANEMRRELARRSRQLAEQVLIGKMSVQDAGAVLHSLPEPPSAFPRSEMIEASKKKFQKLPEICQRRDQLQKEFEYCTNRIRAKMYLQKQQYAALLKPKPPR